MTEITKEVRQWGSYIILEEETNNYKIKRISVEPGKALSLQMHHHRSEHWVIVHGTAEVILDEDQILVLRGESIFVPKGTKHQLRNPGKIILEVIEVAIGEYINEDDIVRFEDEMGDPSVQETPK